MSSEPPSLMSVPAAGHVGRDRDRAGHAGLGDDVGFLLMEGGGVQHREQLGRLAARAAA